MRQSFLRICRGPMEGRGMPSRAWWHVDFSNLSGDPVGVNDSLMLILWFIVVMVFVAIPIIVYFLIHSRQSA